MKAVAYTPEALAGLRKHRNQAAAIIAKVKRYAETGAGDIKTLTGRTGKRLRCGDYRVFFDQRDENTINVSAVRHRREAYR